ncbi:MAG: Rieske 2Fe-2S domain-containing protein [Chamaesiphon sp. CSU_1_12]|nr:Rieske 2Fe-2S domain-containing protein [Chamaesiphon sp. CSU_1_12]
MTAISTIANESEANNSSGAETFQWMQQWYPVAVVEFLDPKKPHAFQLLGKNVVLWRDGAQQWQCFEDACPHRLAPLSEGRVEADGTLLCAYHGWRFDRDGNCTKIPQSQTPALEAQHRANPKSCAIAYPTQEAQGLLWVWAESGTKAAVESKKRSPRIITELESKSDRVVKLFWNIRDMPYGWDYFMENVADPAHVPVSHHGLVGDRDLGSRSVARIALYCTDRANEPDFNSFCRTNIDRIRLDSSGLWHSSAHRLVLCLRV